MSDAVKWKLENGLCRCCLSEGLFKSLASSFILDGQENIYSDILKECLDITIAPMIGDFSAVTYTICDACILRLRDAHNFRQRVIASENKFRDYYGTHVVKALEPIKVEVVEDEAFKYEYVDHDDFNYPESDEDERKLIELKVEVEPITKKGKGKGKTKASAPEAEPPAEKRTRPKRAKPEEKKETAVVAKKSPAKSATGAGKKIAKGTDAATASKYYVRTKDPKTGENVYACQCGKSFKSHKLMYQHYKGVHLKQRSEQRKCPQCDVLLSKYARAYHLEEVHGIAAPTCGICGKKFPYPNHLMRHQRNFHMLEKNFSCTVCKKQFFHNYHLQRHMAKHSTERKFQCHVCNKRYAWRNNLEVHVRSHTGSKPYACKLCDAAFTENRGLKNHVAKRHPQTK